MTDQIPAGLTRDEAQAVREWAERARGAEVQDGAVAHAARVLLAVLPKHPTLADMTPEERAECQRMQAYVKGYDRRVVIIQPYWKDGSARVMWATSRVETLPWASITPRPDLPRLEWPGDTPAPAAPALPPGWKLADHPNYGRVIVTSATPDTDGHVYFVAPAPDPIGNDWHLCQHDELTYLDTPAPPNTITLGSKWNDTDALANACEESGRDQITVLDANGYAFIWAYDAEWWEGSAQPIDAPFTIIHTGREADQ